jgi:hypothetical protein
MGAIKGVGVVRRGGLGSSTSPSSGEDVRGRFVCLLPSGDLEAFLLRGVATITGVAFQLGVRRRRRPVCNCVIWRRTEFNVGSRPTTII